MSPFKATYTKTCRLLLMLLVAAGVWGGGDVPEHTSNSSKEQVYSSPSKGANGGELVSAVWEHGCEALRPTGQSMPAAAKIAGDGDGGPQGRKSSVGALLPSGTLSILHSQAALKLRLSTLLTHAGWQQRLALYPKHGFW